MMRPAGLSYYVCRGKPEPEAASLILPVVVGLFLQIAYACFVYCPSTPANKLHSHELTLLFMGPRDDTARFSGSSSSSVLALV
jgi:hypothetical protein